MKYFLAGMVVWSFAMAALVRFMIHRQKASDADKARFELDWQARQFDIHKCEALWRV